MDQDVFIKIRADEQCFMYDQVGPIDLENLHGGVCMGYLLPVLCSKLQFFLSWIIYTLL